LIDGSKSDDFQRKTSNETVRKVVFPKKILKTLCIHHIDPEMESVELAVDEVEIEIENEIESVVKKIRRVLDSETKAPRNHGHVV
jgi:hypothetical protein